MTEVSGIPDSSITYRVTIHNGKNLLPGKWVATVAGPLAARVVRIMSTANPPWSTRGFYHCEWSPCKIFQCAASMPHVASVRCAPFPAQTWRDSRCRFLWPFRITNDATKKTDRARRSPFSPSIVFEHPSSPLSLYGRSVSSGFVSPSSAALWQKIAFATLEMQGGREHRFG